MKIKTIIFFFMLLVFALAQTENQDDTGGNTPANGGDNGAGNGGDNTNPDNGNNGGDNTKPDNGNNNGGDNNKPDNGNNNDNNNGGNNGQNNNNNNNGGNNGQNNNNNNGGNNGQNNNNNNNGGNNGQNNNNNQNQNSTKQVQPTPATQPPNTTPATKVVASSTAATAAQTTAPAASAAPKSADKPSSTVAPPATTSAKPLDPAKTNGTPTPTVMANRDTVTQQSKEETNWSKILLIGGGIIGALFVVGIIFNFINKSKESNSDPINDINFVVDNQAPEPEMSTSMFTQQNDMYGQQQDAGYNDYNMQYGQYDAGMDNQYNQPVAGAVAADPYGQGYGQEVNYAQRTMSLNRNPAANNQMYQNDENARDVIYNHRPEAGDEIELRRGDKATIYEKYEDGWAWGYNITTGKTGMFPQQCLA